MNEVAPEALAFREGMSRLGAAVNLVATDGPAGRFGLTVSAVCSVTDTPPTLLVCINRKSFSHDAFIENAVLSVNVLSEEHQCLSQTFSRRIEGDRFDFGQWERRVTGAPCLSDAAVSFDCRVADASLRGTHSVLFCHVLSTSLRQGSSGGLIWYRRNFHPLACH